MPEKILHISGKRKKAIARTTIQSGKGVVRINKIPLPVYGTDVSRMLVQEVLLLAKDHVDLSAINIDTTVKGGGVISQAEAAANSIARGLSQWTGGEALLSHYLAFNRTLIAGDSRLTEPHKPSQSSKGPRHKRQKSYR
ncbi:30S ribosomal protein S9 [uncultured archaeon]|nr:30S ribosomal protein S9 [uncultured archaeon]